MSDIHNPDRSSSSPGADNHITWDNTLIYTGNPLTWTDIDGKVGQCVLIMRIEYLDDGSSNAVYFRKHGVSADGVSGQMVSSTCSSVATQFAYAILATDVAGHIDIKSDAHLGAPLAVYRIGYIKPAMPRTVWSGAQAPTAWSDLALGVKNALCFLRISRVGTAGAQSVSFRQKSEALDEQTGGYDCAANNSWDATVDAYVAILTDDAGLVQWKAGWQYSFRIMLEAYIPVKDLVAETVVNGAIPGGLTDITSTFGKSLVFAKGVGDHNTAWAKFQEHDAVSNSSNIPGMMACWGGNNKVCYSMLLFDATGTIQWIQAGGGAHNLNVTKLARLT